MAQSNSQFYTEFVDTKKLTQEATQIEVPNLEATTDGKKLFTPKQWLERFRQYTKENKIDTTELFRKTELTQTGWIKTENQIQKDVLWVIAH